jgi:hypothetical protein
MNAIRIAFREFLGLFVDDGSLALFVILLIALVTAAVEEDWLPPLAGGAALLIGLVLLLMESVNRAARARR